MCIETPKGPDLAEDRRNLAVLRGLQCERAVVVALLLATACARGALVPPPPGPPEPGSPGVTVTLRWNAAVDLDLYVTDPVLETVYFANPRSASGGVLEQDARCADRSAGVQTERVRWTAPVPGRYRIGVDFLEACGARLDEVAWSLSIDVDGTRKETTGRARRAERQPAVTEFIVEGR
jgi:hypothetical protein